MGERAKGNIRVDATYKPTQSKTVIVEFTLTFDKSGGPPNQQALCTFVQDIKQAAAALGLQPTLSITENTTDLNA